MGGRKRGSGEHSKYSKYSKWGDGRGALENSHTPPTITVPTIPTTNLCLPYTILYLRSIPCLPYTILYLRGTRCRPGMCTSRPTHRLWGRSRRLGCEPSSEPTAWAHTAPVGIVSIVSIVSMSPALNPLLEPCYFYHVVRDGTTDPSTPLQIPQRHLAE